MRRLLRSLIVLLAIAGTPAWSATLEVTRAQAQAARKQVNDIRKRQMSLRMELNQVASRIEALKAKEKGPLLPGGELESDLRRSQELSGQLTSAAQELSQAESESERDQLALLEALSAELSSSRTQWDHSQDRTERGHLLDRMRSLRSERDQVRSLIPAAKVPAVTTTRSDDPTDLLEQADALRDSEDKVRQKMVALRARIAELHEERELDRRMNDFLGDESLFDDHDRRLRSVESTHLDQAGAAAPQKDAVQSPGAGSFNPSNDTTPPRTVSITQTARASDSRPQMGGLTGSAPDFPDTANLPELEKQLDKLDDMAKSLHDRAERIEQKARDLK
jgi:uncharacterized coiled-coil DUF342 family protein